MSLKFRDELVIGGSGEWDYKPFRFNVRKINIGKSEPSWKDIIVSGVSPLVLTNAIEDGLNYLKLFGDTEQRNLPSGYTQVEYLESSGTQYIDTGYVPTKNTKIEIRNIQKVNDTAFGVAGQIYVFHTGQNYYNFGGAPNSGTFTGTGLVDLDATIVMSEDDGLVINGQQVVAFSNVNDFTTDLTFWLFARNNTTPSYKMGAQRTYYFKMWNNGTLVRNLIPCKRNSDNVLGMYDTITNTFLTNAGTGTFTAGAVVAPTPTTPVDIVCNNGVVKVNTEASGKNAIDTSDTEVGYLISTVGQQPRINTSTASIVIKNAIKVSNGKKYKFSYYSNVAGNREYNIVDNNGIVTLKIGLSCDIGLNEYIIEANSDGYLWITVQNGDFATVKPSTYEIGLYVDGTTGTVEVHSKNLFNKNNALLDTTINESGSFEANNNFNCSNYIPVQYGKNYMRSNNGTRFGVRYHLYDSNKNWLGYVDAAQTGLIVVNNSSAKYVAFAISKTVNLDNVQVEQGSTATAYESYFNGGSATAEMLLKVGTYQDVQDVLSGDVTRNVGIKVLDGTENIYDGTSGYWGIASSYFPNIKMKTSGAILTTSWREGDYLSSIGAYCSILGTSYFAFNKASLPNASTAEAVKQWLADQYNAGTPVIIVYPLATATTESVSGQPLTVQTGTNIVTITQASINNLTLEVSYKAAAQVTITEVQNSQLSNNVEVTIND